MLPVKVLGRKTASVILASIAITVCLVVYGSLSNANVTTSELAQTVASGSVGKRVP